MVNLIKGVLVTWWAECQYVYRSEAPEELIYNSSDDFISFRLFTHFLLSVIRQWNNFSCIWTKSRHLAVNSFSSIWMRRTYSFQLTSLKLCRVNLTIWWIASVSHFTRKPTKIPIPHLELISTHHQSSPTKKSERKIREKENRNKNDFPWIKSY